MRKLLELEPVVVRGVIITLIGAAINLGVQFGLEVSENQTLAIQGFVTAVLAVVYLFTTRAVVTPSALVVAQENKDGKTIAGEASVVETGAPVTVDVEPIGSDGW